ncbi:hypothetical protein [Nitrosomonas sp. wSCUT-2]
MRAPSLQRNYLIQIKLIDEVLLRKESQSKEIWAGGGGFLDHADRNIAHSQMVSCLTSQSSGCAVVASSRYSMINHPLGS